MDVVNITVIDIKELKFQVAENKEKQLKILINKSGKSEN
jgi:hypothetical protein